MKVCALAWILLPGCAGRQTENSTVPEAGKPGESKAGLEAHASGSRFSPLEIASIDGAEDEDGGLRLGEALLFEAGSHRLKKSAIALLDRVIALLEREHPGWTIVIEGHADYQPLHKAQQGCMNLAYGRMRSVFTYFVEGGVAENRMQLTSYGYSKLLDEPGSRANRRVVIRLAPPET